MNTTNTQTRRSAERESFLALIITTALEGGIGYWSQATEYRWYYPDIAGGTADPAPNGGGNAFARIIETEANVDPEECPTWDITPDVVATGLRRIASTQDIRYLNATDRKTIRYCDRHNTTAPDDGPDWARDIDSDLADVIVQVALLGEVVYG